MSQENIECKNSQKEVIDNLQKAIVDYVNYFYSTIDMHIFKEQAARVASKVMSITTDTLSSLSIIGILINVPGE